MLKMWVLPSLFLIGTCYPVQAADAPSELPLCPSTRKIVATKPLLRQALKAAYPGILERPRKLHHSSTPCRYPYQALSFNKFVVFITLGGVPGEACHGCGAKISADFLNFDNGRLKPVGSHDTFTEEGTWGSPGRVKPLRLGLEAGIVIEGGGTFQGYTYKYASLFLIRNGRMAPIGPKEGISLGGDSCELSDKPCRSIEGLWHVNGPQFIVRYVGAWEDGTRVNGSVVYELRNDSLVRISGHNLANEMEESAL
ncbi:hypothetical protein [Microvirga soli]|uniref:hypothetical protein n=1 Tax=Microvirga soli TaxID=1854496 RepID=UPI00191EED2E|nr:hypothetical protein [Microvirga soli]